VLKTDGYRPGISGAPVKMVRRSKWCAGQNGAPANIKRRLKGVKALKALKALKAMTATKG
jgi:hypothetical protein|tara:strand:+ start:2831 stop:3010 length:180 start_codon:yes stop_codon:yes gene_type:complete